MSTETGVYDSSRWTGISETDQEEDDSWLPEEIVPRLSRFRALLHLIGSILTLSFFSFAPLAIISFFLDSDISNKFFAEYSKTDFLEEFGIIVLIPSFLCSFYAFFLRYLRHIARYMRIDYLLKINRQGISTKDTGQFFPWNSIFEVSVSSHPLFPGSFITISQETAKRSNKSSNWIPLETHTWCLDGTDVDFHLLERSTKRWHELAQEKQHNEAQA